jgi:hypothetical protein
VTRQDDFFGDPPFLAWLADETLFSLVSRHHRLWGHSIARRTATLLFGHVRGGAHHDLPSYLGEFVNRTGGVHGRVEQLAREHTLLKYYAAFISPAEVDNAVACMAGRNVAHLKLRLGILTSRFRANHPLKACEACMDDDIDTEGWAYWHLEHQYPGVWICLKHGRLLRESVFKSSGVERFQWHLPSADCLRPLPAEVLATVNGAETALMDFSRLVVNLVNRATLDPIDPSRLHEMYRVELNRRSWVTSGGSLRMPALAESYLQHVKPLRVLPELSALPESVAAAAIQVGRILRAPRSGTHPLRHLLVISWLFATPDAFWAAYQSALSLATPPSIDKDGSKAGQPDQVQDQDPRIERLIRLFSEPGMSVRSVSHTVGIDVATAMAWAAQAGIETGRRPKKLKTELRNAVIAELTRGSDKQAVADQAGLSIGTITRFLLTEVGLHATWVKAREDQARAAARQAWIGVLQTHAEAGTKFMRALEPRAYAWLYRNDRAWLDSQKPIPLITVTSNGTTRIAWDDRDETLSAQVRRAVLDIQSSNKVKKLKLWEIYQAVPELKAKLGALNRLPLTRQAIDDALRSSPLISTPNLFD